MGLLVRFLYEQAHRTESIDGEIIEQSHASERQTPQNIQEYEHNPEWPVARPTVGQNVPQLVSMIEATQRTDLTSEKSPKLRKLRREKPQLVIQRTATDGPEHNIGVPTTDEPTITYEGILAGFSEEEKALMERSGTAAQRRRGR